MVMMAIVAVGNPLPPASLPCGEEATGLDKERSRGLHARSGNLVCLACSCRLVACRVSRVPVPGPISCPWSWPCSCRSIGFQLAEEGDVVDGDGLVCGWLHDLQLSLSARLLPQQCPSLAHWLSRSLTLTLSLSHTLSLQTAWSAWAPEPSTRSPSCLNRGELRNNGGE